MVVGLSSFMLNLWIKCITIFRELIGRIKSMARPRIVKTKEGGEVIIKNLSADVADQIKALLTGETPVKERVVEPVSAAVPSSEPKKELNMSNFTNTALGTFKGPDGIWKVAVVKFDPTTKEASVETIVNAGEEKEYAIERYKILSAEYNLV